jgi:hypothetical protein
MPGSTEQEDIITIKYIFIGYDENRTYQDIYNEIKTKGVYDPSLAILEKWLFRYSLYNVKQFREII